MERILKSFKTFPSLMGWVETLSYAAIFFGFAIVIEPDFINLSNRPEISEIFIIAIIAFFIPCLFEETLFRGLLLPKFNSLWVLISLFAFIIWHPIQALTYLPDASPIFLSNRFLILVALLGGFCTLAYMRTKSLWSCIFLHWVVVVSWRALGGARFVY